MLGRLAPSGLARRSFLDFGSACRPFHAWLTIRRVPIKAAVDAADPGRLFPQITLSKRIAWMIRRTFLKTLIAGAGASMIDSSMMAADALAKAALLLLIQNLRKL